MFIILFMNYSSFERKDKMPRPQKERKVQEPPKIQGMKPIGVPGKLLEQVILSIDEYEAIRLSDYEDLDHQKAADKMGVSRPTFTRLIDKAHKKIAETIVGVKDLIIEGGSYSFIRNLVRCFDCGAVSVIEKLKSEIIDCPECNSTNIVHLNKWFGNRQQGGRKGGFGGRRGRGNW